MVFFTCNACGQSVKKNQVEKHYKLQCRNCQVLSCMDCGKDFHGDEYMSHTKCVSEDQKYGGKDYKPKPNTNKGEAKQEEWILSIQNTIDTTKVRPALAQLLKQLMTFNNIPRHEIKFQKFLENSFKIRDKALIKEAWKIFSSAKEKSKKPSINENDSAKSSSEAVHNNNKKNKRPNKDSSNNSEAKKEEPVTKKHKKSKKHKDTNNHVDQENQKLAKECSNGSENHISETVVEHTASKKRKKGKKNKDMDNQIVQEKKPNANISMESEMENSSMISNNDDSKGKKKFNWKKIIKAVLKNSSDNEISLKKLQKKVLAEYYAMGGEPRPMDENELRATFRKKVTNNPKFKVHKEKVKLVS